MTAARAEKLDLDKYFVTQEGEFVDMLKYIKHLFKYIFTRNRRCVDCGYMRKNEYGPNAGCWFCAASCGNDEGKTCGAWFPRMPDRESPDASAKFFKAHGTAGGNA